MNINVLNVIGFIKELISDGGKMTKFKELIDDIKELIADIKDVVNTVKG